MKNKAQFYDDILALSHSYWGFRRGVYKGTRGCFYKFDRLQYEELENLKSKNNIAIFNVQSEYAPEQKRVMIFLGDTRFKEVNNA